MEALLDRAYERFGPHYFWVAVLGAIPFNVFATVVSVFALTLYFDGTLRQAVELFVAAVPLSVTCILITFFSFHHLLDPGFRWLRGERDQATSVAAWNAFTTSIYRIVKRGVLIFCIPYAFFPLYIMWRMGLPGRAYPGLLGAILVVILWSGTMIHLWLDFAFRPALTDLARSLPPEFDRRPAKLSARHKLLVSSTVFATANILLIGVIPFAQDLDPATGLGVVVMVAIVASLTVAFVGNGFMVRSMFGQVDTLLLATRAVGSGDLSTRVPLISGDEFGNLAHGFNRMVTGLAEREALRSALGSYVDPVITDRLLAEGELLEGEELDVTILVLDIRGFTALAEVQPAKETVAYLNDLFAKVVPLVAGAGGHINKFTGDGLLAVFGAPEQHSDHADRAVAAACAIAGAVDGASPGGSRVGIGLNSGAVVVGTVGGGGHLEFAVIGDVVNVATRIEALTKETGDIVLLTDATRERLTRPIDLMSRGSFTLRGRNEAIEVFGVGPDCGKTS